MKNILRFGILLISLLLVHACKVKKQAGTSQLAKIYHTNGKLHISGNIANGHWSDSVYTYTESGPLEKVEFYKDRVCQKLMSYAENGTLTSLVKRKKGQALAYKMIYKPNGNYSQHYTLPLRDDNLYNRDYNYEKRIKVGAYFQYFEDRNQLQSFSIKGYSSAYQKYLPWVNWDENLKQWGVSDKNGKRNAEYFQGEYTAKTNLPTGKWLLKDQKSIPILKVDFSNGKLTGAFNYYSGKGVLLYEANYKDDVPNGPFHIFSEKGLPLVEGAYAKGKKNGIWKHYTTEGVLEKEEHFEDGIPASTTKIFYPNSTQLLELIQYDNGAQLINEGISWHKNGNISKFKNQVSYYENGEVTLEHHEKAKLYQKYHENGVLAELRIHPLRILYDTKGKVTTAYYKKSYGKNLIARHSIRGLSLRNENKKVSKFPNRLKWVAAPKLQLKEDLILDEAGRRDGIYRLYYPTGQILIEMNYTSGQLDGPVTSWNLKGEIRHQANFYKGLLDGEYIEYSANGTILKKEHYNKGTAIDTQIEYDFNTGDTLKVYDPKTETAKIYGQGFLHKIERFKKGKLHGFQLEYFSKSNQVKNSHNYQMGLKHGVSTEVDEKGNSLKGSYSYGKEHGTFVYSDSSGKTLVISQYILGHLVAEEKKN